MTKLFLSLFLSASVSIISFSQKDKFSCSAVKSHNKSLKSNTLTVQQIAETERYDVHFYALDLAMTNLSTDLSGVVEIHATCREDLDSATFELFNSFTINDIKINGISSPYSQIATAIKVPVNLLMNENFILSIDYQGTPPNASTNPLGGAGMTNDSSPSWGNRVTWSLSEPFSAFEWFPCKQSLSDKADSCTVNITVPSTCKAGSNGTLILEEDLGNGFTKFHWKHNYPIDYYLISVAVAEYVDYTIYANPVGAPNPIPVQNYIYNNPGTLPNFKADIDETVDFIELFSDIFGLYPFYKEKYGHCMAPLGGGMEHQTMTTQGYFNNTLTAHELAHQWWGDHVTCKSWADIWVNEGFASYAEYIMLANLYPGQQVQDMNDRHNNIKSQTGGSVYVLDSLNSNRVFSGRLTYDKGAAIVHTFRYLVNDDVKFFQALRDYQTSHSFDVALGVDVQSALENVSGLDLSAAFEQWYFGEGYPTYAAKWNVADNNLYINLTQTTSKPSVTPLFTTPLEIKLARSSMIDTIIKVNINSANETYILSGLENVTNLSQFDPNNWIINNAGLIQRDLTLGTNAVNEVKIEEELNISPNPASNELIITFTDTKAYKLTILDPKGGLVEERTVNSGSKINCSSWSNGLYLFQLESEDGERIIRKVVRK